MLLRLEVSRPVRLTSWLVSVSKRSAFALKAVGEQNPGRHGCRKPRLHPIEVVRTPGGLLDHLWEECWPGQRAGLLSLTSVPEERLGVQFRCIQALKERLPLNRLSPERQVKARVHLGSSRRLSRRAVWRSGWLTDRWKGDYRIVGQFAGGDGYGPAHAGSQRHRSHRAEAAGARSQTRVSVDPLQPSRWALVRLGLLASGRKGKGDVIPVVPREEELATPASAQRSAM